MTSLKTFSLAIIAVIMVTGLFSCSDHCTDVACGPAPPPLTVIVKDTITVDTVSIGGLDTMIVFVRPTTEAVVTLQHVIGNDTLTFDTLNATTENEYMLRDPSNLPDSIFMFRAERDGRAIVSGNVQVQMVDGCCPYPIIGRYTVQLPGKP
jgi:hypothetical protein